MPHTSTLIAAVILLGSVAMLSACHTVAGAGQDVSAVGHGVSNTANGDRH